MYDVVFQFKIFAFFKEGFKDMSRRFPFLSFPFPQDKEAEFSFCLDHHLQGLKTLAMQLHAVLA